MLDKDEILKERYKIKLFS